MGNEEVKQSEKQNQAEDKRDNNDSSYFSSIVKFVFSKVVEYDYFTIAFRLAKEKLSPIGNGISWAVGIFGVLVSPDDYRLPLIIILAVMLTGFFAYMFYQYKKLNRKCVVFPVQNRPSRHFYILNGGFEENMKYVMSEERFKTGNYAFAMGIDQTLELGKSTKKGILSSVLEILKNDYNVDIQTLQGEINSKRLELLEYKKNHFLPELIDFGDVIDVCANGKSPVGTEKAAEQSDLKIHLLLIVNSKKKFSDEECLDSEKFESVEGIDSRIIVIKLFEYCRKKKIQNVMLGAMGTNGLNFPFYVIVREIVNAYCYWFGQLAFDSTSPLNVILSLRMKDIARHAGEMSKIISYVDWMIDRRKETITK